MRKARLEYSIFIEHLAYVVLQILSDNDGKMLLSELWVALEKREGENIPADQKERNNDGQVKWQTRVQFAVDLYIKKGYLLRQKGVWHLTPEGEKALSSTSKDELIADAKKHYREWEKDRKRSRAGEGARALDEGDDGDGAGDAEVDAGAKDKIETYESDAKTDIKKHIQSLDPYEFQELCAALLRGMGYYIRTVAAKGPDGGVDIIAYTDPLGFKPPHIIVQVKHFLKSGQKVSNSTLKELAGTLRKEGDIGMLITSSGFTRECEKDALAQQKHIELIDFERFVELWVEHYDKLSWEDKSLLPLQPIYFLDPRNG